MLISEMPADEAAEKLYTAYMAAHQSYDRDNDEHGRHPSHDYNRWVDIAATGGTNSEKRIQSQDDDQPALTANGNSGNGGATPAQDSARINAAYAVEEARIRHSGSATMDADLHAARARRSDPRKIRGMSLAIKGYDRIK